MTRSGDWVVGLLLRGWKSAWVEALVANRLSAPSSMVRVAVDCVTDRDRERDTPVGRRESYRVLPDGKPALAWHFDHGILNT